MTGAASRNGFVIGITERAVTELPSLSQYPTPILISVYASSIPTGAKPGCPAMAHVAPLHTCTITNFGRPTICVCKLATASNVISCSNDPTTHFYSDLNSG